MALFGFAFGDDLGEFGNVFKAFIDGREADISDLVDFCQLFHRHFADDARSDFFFAQTVEALLDKGNGFIDLFLRDRAFVQRALKAGLQFVRIEGNPCAVGFDDLRHPHFNGFKGAEALSAFQAFATATDAVGVFQPSRVGYLCVGVLAKRALHRVSLSYARQGR